MTLNISFFRFVISETQGSIYFSSFFPLSLQSAVEALLEVVEYFPNILFWYTHLMSFQAARGICLCIFLYYTIGVFKGSGVSAHCLLRTTDWVFSV